MEIKSSKIISISEAKEILEKRGEEGELGYEQAQGLEHAKKFATESTKNIEKIAKHDKITEELAIKIASISPNDPSTIKAIAAKDKIELSDDEASEILKDLI